MIHLTNMDADWLLKLLELTEANYESYPELFNEDEVDTIKVNSQLIRSIT